MRHLVTGAAGFLGSHLSDALLAQGHEVIGLDNLFTGSRENMPSHSRFDFVRADVCDTFHFEADVIWNAACPASPKHYQKNPARTIETGFVGTWNALKCARACGARMIQFSTSEVYGSPEISPQREDYWGHVNPVGDRACYDESKRAAESLCVAFNQQFGTDVRIARVFNTYGPRLAQGDGRVVSNFIVQALRGEKLTVYGDGMQTRSFAYCDDTIAGLLALAKMQSHRYRGVEIVNLGNPDERTILSLAEDVIRIVGSGEIEFRGLPADDPRRRCPDITRARELLGWEPKVSTLDGIGRTVEWFRGRVKGKEAA